MRAQEILFGPADLQTPGILKVSLEWEQKRRERAAQEEERVRAGHAFDYEPHHFAWCAFYTREREIERARDGDDEKLRELLHAGAARMNPVTGEIMTVYELCAWHNPVGECASYSPRDDA